MKVRKRRNADGKVEMPMKPKIVYLDGVRGLAACIVVVCHFFQVFLLRLSLRAELACGHQSALDQCDIGHRRHIHGLLPLLEYAGKHLFHFVWEAPGFSFFEFYHVIGSLLILTALLNSSRMQTLFNRKPFAYLGKISFSLYLVHFTFICTLGSYIFGSSIPHCLTG